MERNEEWDCCKPKEDTGAWLVGGAFLVLWGISELLGDMFWWASAEFLWGVFLLGVGGTILVKVAQKVLGRRVD